MTTQNAFPNKLTGHKFAVSDLKFFETENDLLGGEFNLTRLDKKKGIVFHKNNERPDPGSYVSPIIKSPFPMTELIPSWNADVPSSTGFSISVQISIDGVNFSPWLFIGREGEAPLPEPKIQSWNEAAVDVDYILSSEPFSYYRWKADFFSADPKNVSSLKLFTVCHGNSKGSEALFNKFAKNALPSKPLIKKLDIPYRSQLADHPDITDRMKRAICCPTSLSMALEYYGVSLPLRNVCDICFDRDNRIWGNWARAAQTLHQFGLRSHVAQIRSFEEIKPFIARGIPLIISVRASEGDLPSAPYKKTSGHILIISGVDQNDTVWVNDPYNTDGKEGARLWTRKEIETVLIGKGGVVIVAEPR